MYGGQLICDANGIGVCQRQTPAFPFAGYYQKPDKSIGEISGFFTKRIFI
jgi:hypothetical protein